ncbi:SEL1-like repeat protein [Pseudovibrio sp. Tun.PSC04-5.I4]|uniref:tetratricopeptide repeat protein n=1 Tax=Pseudovibrio sp. Tun.PSC04-5.I4 TaxID=1798213 RepID=UPI0013566B79|nr:SEL1-like repeat protein [Pseudovibrio sp. Tun.PSC04-5.I4]
MEISRNERTKRGIEDKVVGQSLLKKYQSDVESFDVDEVRLLAEQGDLKAQFQLGDAFWQGFGVEINYEKAFYWLNKAAQGNYLDALTSLALMYEFGQFVEKDEKRASELYFDASQQGSDWALAQLADMYIDGRGVRKDMPYGLGLLNQLAQGEYHEALLYLGEFYDDGRDGAPNYEKAAEYYERSRAAGSNIAATHLAFLKYYEHLGPVDIEDVIVLFEENLPDRTSRAALGLGHIYFDGVDAPRDYEKALEYYELAASWGSRYAYLRIGSMFEGGHGVAQNYAKAAEYYQSAIKSGYAVASADIAYLYERGFGFEEDLLKAKELYETANGVGSSFAAFRLGLLYYYGSGVEPDYPKALGYFLSAARDGNDAAYPYLGLTYHYGYGVTPDPFEARYWYERAIKAGSDFVKIDLAFLLEDGLGGSLDLQRAEQLYKDASSEDPDALYHLARIADAADTEGKQTSKHLTAYLEAAKKGSNRAKLKLAVVYIYGEGELRNLKKAESLLLELAEANWTDAYVYLGVLNDEMIYDRKGTQQEAVKWLSKAADNGNRFAAERLALKYKNGYQVEASKTKFVH